MSKRSKRNRRSKPPAATRPSTTDARPSAPRAPAADEAPRGEGLSTATSGAPPSRPPIAPPLAGDSDEFPSSLPTQPHGTHLSPLAAAAAALLAAVIAFVHHTSGAFDAISRAVADRNARGHLAGENEAAISTVLPQDPSQPLEATDVLAACARRGAAAVVVDAGVSLAAVAGPAGLPLIAGSDLLPTGRSGERSLVPAYGPVPPWPPLPEGEAATPPRARVGYSEFAPDDDGVVRRVAVAATAGDEVLPSLPVAAGMEIYRESSLQLGDRGRTLLSFASLDLPLDARGNLRVQFRGPAGTFRRSLAAPSSATLEQVAKGDVVVIGDGTAIDTPVGPMSRAELIANVLHNLQRGDALAESGRLFETSLAMLLAAVTGTLVAWRPRPLTIVVALVIAWAFAMWLASLRYRQGTVADVAPALVGTLCAAAAVYLLLRRDADTAGRSPR